MIDPEKVEVLIFDLDGTLSATTEPVFHAIQKAFSRLDIPFTLTRRELEGYLGAPSEEFYRGIMPKGCDIPWQTVREAITKEQPAAFRQYGQTFHGVKETLTELKERGYKLALCSNCTTHYFTTVISTLDLFHHFDYTECIGDNNLTKSEVVQKIIRHFGNPPAAMTGDRLHDIEAARENGALAIGCLYGYGGKEPNAADITIDKFSDLLSIFDRRNPVFTALLEEMLARKKLDTPLITGITGIDASGKTAFTEAFTGFLEDKGYTVQVIHIDDFHNPRNYRYAGVDEADNYYNRSFDIRTIIDHLLIPARQSGRYETVLTVLSLETDEYDTTIRYTFSPETLVLLEGVFLLREELRPYIDFMVFLEIPLEESKTRALIRDSEVVLSKYDTKYTPAQRRYLEQNPPGQFTDIIIDNLNWNDPEIVSKDKI